MAWFLILKTKKKWLWAGLFNVFAGIFASAGYLIPDDCKPPIFDCVLN